MVVRATYHRQQWQQMAIVFTTQSSFWWMIQRSEWLNYEVYCFHNQLWIISGWSIVVRVIMELARDERLYENLHMQSLGPLHLVLKNISKNYCYSESYEIHALCNVLECNIRSFCPSIGMHPVILAMLNKVFTPMPSRNAKCTITILWSHSNMEMDAKAMNHGNWSPNHFVPLLSSGRSTRSDDDSSSPSVKVYRIDELSVLINLSLDSWEENGQERPYQHSSSTSLRIISKST